MLIVFFSFMLHLAISNDEKASQPSDDMIRAEAKVINFPDSYSIIQDGNARELYTGIQISIQLSEKEKYEGLLEGTVPKDKVGKLEYGSMLKVKYAEKGIFTEEEIQKIFTAVNTIASKKCNTRQSHDYNLLFTMLLQCGMRVGELLALQWQDVNFQKREIHVHATKVRCKQEFNSTKTMSFF